MNTRVRWWRGMLLGLVAIGLAVTEVRAQSTDLRGVARAAGRPSSDTIVWLEAPDARPPATPPRARLDQRNLSFIPKVLVVRAGTVVDFPNNDTVFHNVFSFRDGKRFDLGLYPVGTLRRVTFDRPGLSRVFCNIHPNMAAYVVTVDSPYFARSDDDGRFTIAGVPVGTYTYHAWRPGAVEEITGTWASPDGALSITWP